MKTIRLEGNALEALAGPLDETLRLIEDRFRVRISARGGEVSVTGDQLDRFYAELSQTK